MKTKYSSGLAFLWHPKHGTFSGNLRRRKNRWWFFGDVCRGFKGRLDYLLSRGCKLTGGVR